MDSFSVEEKYERDRKGKTPAKKFRDTAPAHGAVVRKVKAQKELKLANNVKHSKKGSYSYISK